MEEVGGQVIHVVNKQMEMAYEALKDILSVSIKLGIFVGSTVKKNYDNKKENDKKLRSGEVELETFIKEGVQPISIGELEEKDLKNFEKNAHKYSVDYVKFKSPKDSNKYEIIVDQSKLWRAERVMKDTIEERVAEILAEKNNTSKENMLEKVKEVNNDKGLTIFERANENSEFWDKQLNKENLNNTLTEGLTKKENFIVKFENAFSMSNETFVNIPNKGIVHLDKNNMLNIYKFDTNTHIRLDLNGKDKDIKEIKKTIKNKNEIIRYANKQINEKYKDYSLGQKNIIRNTIISGYDVSKLDNKKFPPEKMTAILACMEDGVNVNKVLMKDYNAEQVHGLRVAMNEQVDLEYLEDETLTYEQMNEIIGELKKAKAENRDVDIEDINKIKNVIMSKTEETIKDKNNKEEINDIKNEQEKNIVIGKTEETIESTIVINNEEERSNRINEINGVHGEHEIGKDTRKEDRTEKINSLGDSKKTHEEVMQDIKSYKNDMGETTVKTKTTINKEITKDNQKTSKSR